ncbi:lipoyl domain-containing protein [Dokdonia sp.]|uniref:lipoyl domain-containing protein n=1 Tax=Dokdonia sp. TaxID=2024995 RepID=UPI00326481F0
MDIIKTLLQKLFPSNRKQNEVVRELKTNSNFKTKDETEKGENNQGENKITPILLSAFGNSKDYKITAWHFKVGDIVQKGNILCEIENKKLMIEFESMINGRIRSICPANKMMHAGDEVCKIEVV